MRFYSIKDILNIVGFDMPSVDTWRERLVFEIDLLHPRMNPDIRAALFKAVSMEFKKPNSTQVDYQSFFEMLTHKKLFRKLVDSKKLTYDALQKIKLMITLKAAFDQGILKIWCRDVPYGGIANNNHNKFIEYITQEYGASEIQKALAEATKENRQQELANYIEKNVIEQYVDNPVLDASNRLIGGQLIPVKITPDLSLVGTDEAPVTAHAVYIEYHSELDPLMILHNKLVRREPLTSKEENEYGSLKGIGIAEAWRNKIFPHDTKNKNLGDGFIRKIFWRTSKKLVTDEDLVPVLTLPSSLISTGGSNAVHGLGKLYINAREKYRQLLGEAGITKVLNSEYFVQEVVAIKNDAKKTRISVRNAFKPNLRIIGLLEQEEEHNKNVDTATRNKQTIPPLVLFAFDTIRASQMTDRYPSMARLVHARVLIPGYDAYPGTYIPKLNKLGQWVAIKIEDHGIDIFDLDLKNQQRDHDANYDSQPVFKIGDFSIQDQNDLVNKKIYDMKASKWLEEIDFDLYLRDLNGSLNSTLRPSMDERFSWVWTFEEIMSGFYKPLFKLTKEYFTDPRTGQFFWKYENHASHFKDFDDTIAVARAVPADEETLLRVHKMLENATLLETGDSIFDEFFDKQIEMHVSRIKERMPDLAIEILTTKLNVDAKSEEIVNLIAQIDKVERNFSQSNFMDLADSIYKRVEQYRAIISNSYNYAQVSIKPSAGWFYTEKQPWRGQPEPQEMEKSRYKVEFNLKFLEFCYAELQNDFNLPEIQRKWLTDKKKVSKTRKPKPKIAGMTETERKSFENQIAKVLLKWGSITNEEMAESIRKIAANRRSQIQTANGWGDIDMLRGEGNPIVFLTDLFTVMSSAEKDGNPLFNPQTRDFATMMVDKLGLAVDDKASSDYFDLLAAYIMPSEDIANYCSFYLKFYYDIYDPQLNPSGVIAIILDKPSGGGKPRISLFKKIDTLINETLMSFIDDPNSLQVYLNVDLATTPLNDMILAKRFSAGDYFTPGYPAIKVDQAMLKAKIKEMVDLSQQQKQEIKEKGIEKDTLANAIKEELAGVKYKNQLVINMVLFENLSIQQNTLVVLLKDMPTLKSAELETLKTLVRDKLRASTNPVLKFLQIDVQFQIEKALVK